MTLLLVDDRDGRIVAELESQAELAQVLEDWARDQGPLPASLTLVELRSNHGALVGADTSITIRPLQ